MSKKCNSGSSPKGRFFSLVSYQDNTSEILNTLTFKESSLRAYAVIKHDKDNAPVHHHIVLRTNSSWTVESVRKWFSGYVDAKGEMISTLGQLVRDRSAIIDYLTHENETDKYHYDKSDIIDGGLYDILPLDNSVDDSFEIISKMLDGCSTRELVRLYGRDFVYHYGSYQAIVMSIQREENIS